MHTRRWLAGVALAGLFICVGCAPQDGLKQVETEVGDLKLEVFKLRRLLEDTAHKADDDRAVGAEARTQDRRFQADLQETMRQLQETTRILSNRLGDPTVRTRATARPAGTPELPHLDPVPALTDDDKAFNAAMLDYNRGSYAVAYDGLDLFLKASPQSPRRPDALFTMGLCVYNQKAYDKAKPFFEQILKEYPSSTQFLPAKLKRAQCLHRIGMKPAAIKAYKELTDGFNGSPEARTAAQELADLGF